MYIKKNIVSSVYIKYIDGKHLTTSSTYSEKTDGCAKYILEWGQEDTIKQRKGNYFQLRVINYMCLFCFIGKNLKGLC